MGLLSDTEIDVALHELDGWARDGGALAKTYEFDTFGEAMAFMYGAAAAIDDLDHHPEWSNVYNKVVVRLTSHDVGGVTDRDLRLAHALEEVLDD